MKVRELVAKTLLAAVLAERGLGALLITHRRFRPSASWLPAGLVADYSAARPFVPLFRRYRALGHRVVAWEEEGLAPIPSDAVAETDRFLAWGPAEARRAIAADEAAAGKVTVTGNARMDLLRPEFLGLHKPGALRLQQRHGRYVLVNGNFAANVLYSQHELMAQWRMEHARFTPELEAYYAGRWAHSRTLFLAFQEMIPRLAQRHPEVTVIVRPHPAEDLQAWRRGLASQPNVRVLREGNVLHWLLGAEAVIHNSCTTGIEAALMGKPVFAYRPAVSATQDWALANDVSEQVHGLDELLGALDQVLQGRARPPRAAPLRRLRDHVAAMEGPLASERIADVVQQLAPPPRALPGSLATARMVASSAWYDGKHLAKLALGRTAMTLAFEKQKNPGWTGAEVEALLADLRSVTGRFGAVRTAQYGRGATAVWSR